MKISVIIPCYNAELFLDECLLSLEKQSFGDFEAILVDDGSSDHTSEIIRNHMISDHRIRGCFQKNSGVSAARNRGIEMAKGDWIFFLDADDLLVQNAFEILLNYESNDTDMIVGNHCIFSGNNETRIRPIGNWFKLEGRKQKDAVIKRLIEGDSVLNIMCNKLHRRSLIMREKVRLNENVKVAEDALFNLNVAIFSGKIVYVPVVTYRYRIHENSTMKKWKNKGSYTLHLPWLLAMRDLLCSQNLMKRYFLNYLDTIVLHVYKDGGIPEVFKKFQTEIRPLLMSPDIQNQGLSGLNRVVFLIVRENIYPFFYPFIFIFQAIIRKKREFLSHFY